MAKRRGFFAELAYQQGQADRRRQQQAAAAARAHVAAVREHERLLRQADRAQKAAVVANAHDRTRLEREAAQAHADARTAEVEARNTELTKTYEDIDGILAASLSVDDYVDLETLKVTAEHPPFDPGPVSMPTKPAPKLAYPPEPSYVEPPAPGGLFGRKKYAALIAQAQAAHQQDLAQHKANITKLRNEHAAAVERREQAEKERIETFLALEAQYKIEQDEREADAAARNEELTKLINDLAFDVPSAIEEYVGIVLSNSVYPESFPVEREYHFDLTTRELTLTVTAPAPSDLPSVKEYRYVKAKDEIAETALNVKAQKNRYASAITQVAVRTIHEIFEADRGGKIHSISLTVGTNAASPATGLVGTIPFVIVAADREQFSQFDLSNVVPQATLEHLGAAVSKAPFDLTSADTSRGVRIRKQQP